MLVDNSLSGVTGTAPSGASLAATAREGAVTVSSPGRASYEATRLVHGLTTLEVSTGHHRGDTPRLEAALPSAPWFLRFYTYLPSLQAAGNGTDEVRWFADLGSHGLVLHETAGGNIGMSLQASSFDAAPVSPTLSGSAVSVDQWVRIEITSDGTDTVARVYPGHATTGERVSTWAGVGLAGGTAAEVTAYRYRSGAWLNYAPAVFSAEVQTYQQRLIDLGYPAPNWGADGYYGEEMAGQWDAFAADMGMPELVGTFGSGGGAGAEILAACDLAWNDLQGNPTPPPAYLSHLAVDDTAGGIGPASTPGTTAALSATAAVGSSGVKHTSTSATVAGEVALSAPVSKHTSTTATLSATGTIGAEVSARHVPTFPPALTVELGIDDEWVNVTGDVRTREDLLIRRGRADEAAQADPASLTLLLNNRHGKYSPRNPLGPYYGRVGRNTKIRVRAGMLPDPGVTLLRDDFDREVTDGWGTAPTGQVWHDPYDAPQADYFVADGAGQVRLPGVTEIRNQLTTTDLPADFDATYAVTVDQVAAGTGDGGIFAAMRARDIIDAGHVRFYLSFRVDTGKVDGSGLRVSTAIDEITVDDGGDATTSPLTGQQYIPGLGYTPGQRVRVRCQAVGPDVRMRAWADGTPEPTVWHSQAHTSVLHDGQMGLRASLNSGAADTPMPVTMSYTDLEVRTYVAPGPTVRYTGEVSQWPPRWDVSDSDVWVPIQAAGILRRLGQGAKPLQSPLRRTIPTHLPPAYWPLEDGVDTTLATSVVDGVEPLRVSGLRFGEDDTLISSGPLPVIGPGGARIRASCTTADTGSWEANLLYNLESFVPSEETPLFGVLTSTYQWALSLEEFDSEPVLRVRVIGSDGAEMHNQLFFIDQGAVGFFDSWRRLRLQAVQAGSSVDLQVALLDDTDRSTTFSGSFSGTVGHVTGIDTTFGPELEDMAIGHITVWGVRTTAAYLTSFGAHRQIRFRVPETTRDRLNRLETDAGVPILVEGAADTQLGAQAPGTFLDAVTDAQVSDLGVAGEQRHQVGLSYRGRDTLYNQPSVITLDYASGEISPPVEPQDDDQALRNDIEVKRARGAMVTAVDESGPLGVDTVGRYDESVTLSLASDAQLPDQAGWRLRLGTVDELRWPTIRVDLANPRMRRHIETILNLDAGDRIRILNPPHWAQARDLDLIVQGYEERIGAFAWDLTLTCTPASPWIVGQTTDTEEVDPAAPDRADTAGSELAAPVDADTTLLDVVTTRGPEWITTAEHPDDFPLDVMLGGEIVRVTGIAAAGAGPMVGAGSWSEVETTDLVAPSVTAQPDSLLICAWTTFAQPGGTFDLPEEMAALGGVGGVYSAQVAATEPVGPGGTGARTAVLSTTDAWSAVSVAVAGDGATPMVEETAADVADAAPVTVSTSSAVEVGWWVLAIHAWDWDPDQVMGDAVPPGDGWVLVADTVRATSDTSRTRVWARRVAESGVQEVTLPVAPTVTDNHLRLVVLSSVAPTVVGQAFTVTRAINTISKPHEAGTSVRLAQPAIVAL